MRSMIYKVNILIILLCVCGGIKCKAQNPTLDTIHAAHLIYLVEDNYTFAGIVTSEEAIIWNDANSIDCMQVVKMKSKLDKVVLFDPLVLYTILLSFGLELDLSILPINNVALKNLCESKYALLEGVRVLSVKLNRATLENVLSDSKWVSVASTPGSDFVKIGLILP